LVDRAINGDILEFFDKSVIEKDRAGVFLKFKGSSLVRQEGDVP